MFDQVILPKIRHMSTQANFPCDKSVKDGNSAGVYVPLQVGINSCLASDHPVCSTHGFTIPHYGSIHKKRVTAQKIKNK